MILGNEPQLGVQAPIDVIGRDEPKYILVTKSARIVNITLILPGLLVGRVERLDGHVLAAPLAHVDLAEAALAYARIHELDLTRHRSLHTLRHAGARARPGPLVVAAGALATSVAVRVAVRVVARVVCDRLRGGLQRRVDLDRVEVPERVYARHGVGVGDEGRSDAATAARARHGREQRLVLLRLAQRHRVMNIAAANTVKRMLVLHLYLILLELAVQAVFFAVERGVRGGGRIGRGRRAGGRVRAVVVVHVVVVDAVEHVGVGLDQRGRLFLVHDDAELSLIV